MTTVPRHNRKYWTFAPYLGFGPAAHSFMGNRRWWNTRSLDAYLKAIQSAASPIADEETLSRDQQIMEAVLFGGFVRQKGSTRSILSPAFS